jgi:O-antigen biosynthesis protein
MNDLSNNIFSSTQSTSVEKEHDEDLMGSSSISDAGPSGRYSIAAAQHSPDLSPMNAPSGSWKCSTGTPYFEIAGPFPACRATLRLKVNSKKRAIMTLRLDTGNGFNSEEVIQLAYNVIWLDTERIVDFAKPIRAFRLEFLTEPCEFRIEAFELKPLSILTGPLHVLRLKISDLSSRGRLLPGAIYGMKLLMNGKMDEFKEKIFNRAGRNTAESNSYNQWLQENAITSEVRSRIAAESAQIKDPPLISVIMPVYNVSEEYLRLAIESVLKQIYPHWELCIADDCSTAAHIRPVLQEYMAKDARIKVVFRERNGNISAASNSALALATGAFIAFLDNDDEYTEHALFKVARTIVDDRSVDMIYSDEDKIAPNGQFVDPFFKPDWSPEYLHACMYTCHLSVYRKSLVEKLGGLRGEFDTAQDYDLMLRVAASTTRIAHIPDVLYHWRVLPTSTASGSDAKPTAYLTARKALQSYLEFSGAKGTVEEGPRAGFHRVRFNILGKPKVSIVIPSACRPAVIRGEKSSYILKCVESIRTVSTYGNYEILVVDNNDMPSEIEARLVKLRAQRVRYTAPFNLADKMNFGAKAGSGEHLIIMNDDTEVFSDDWIECMLEYSQQPGIGAVGAKLFFPDGTLQHVGVTVLDGNPGHPFYSFPGDHPGYFCSNIVAKNYSAVTGACMMSRAEAFHSVGGFSTCFPLDYNDVDFCLKLMQRGLRTVFTPYAQLLHHESVSKKVKVDNQLHVFRDLWLKKLPYDPFYNPNLSSTDCEYRINGNFRVVDKHMLIMQHRGGSAYAK